MAAAPYRPRVTAKQEWRANWPLAVSAMIGFSILTVPSATLGLFIDPLHREFGWTSTQVSLGLTIFTMISLPLAAVVGALADRIDVPRMAMPGAAAYAGLRSFGSIFGILESMMAVAAVALAGLGPCSAASRAPSLDPAEPSFPAHNGAAAGTASLVTPG